MRQTTAIRWMSFAGGVGIIFGIFYALFGLEGLPAYSRLVPAGALAPWSHGLYGSVFIGFCVVLLLAGRHAFQNNDRELMRILLYGVAAWLAVEALFSFIYGVYFNIGVDIVLMVFLGYPLARGISQNSLRK